MATTPLPEYVGEDNVKHLIQKRFDRLAEDLIEKFERLQAEVTLRLNGMSAKLEARMFPLQEAQNCEMSAELPMSSSEDSLERVLNNASPSERDVQAVVVESTFVKLMDNLILHQKELQERVIEIESRTSDTKAGAQLPAESALEHLQAEAHTPQTYEVDRSVWDAVIFVGLDKFVDIRDSILLWLCFVLNVCIQAFVCYILLRPPFLHVAFQDDEIEAFRFWRQTDAHSTLYADPAFSASLVSRVCLGDQSLTSSTNQQNLHDALDQYLSSQGYILAYVSMFVFVLVCAGEMRMSITFLSALLHLPRANDSVIIRKDAEWRLLSIARSRVLLGISVFVARAAVVTILVYCGCHWLAYTGSTEELLLNASALGFVLEIDAIIYGAFVPPRWTETLRNLKPLKVPSLGSVAPRLSECLFIFSNLIVLIFCFTWILPHVDDMGQVLDILCGGDQDFVYHVNSLSQVMWTATIPHGDDHSQQVLAQRLSVQALIDEDQETIKQMTVQYGSARWFKIVMKYDVTEFVEKVETCDDRGRSLGMMLWSITGQGYFRNESLHRCKDVVAAMPLICESVDQEGMGNFMRYSCPRTCGCGDMASGMHRLSTQGFGCPISACERPMKGFVSTASEGVECKDWAASDLQKTPGWHRFSRVVAPFFLERFSSNLLNFTGPVQVTAFFVEHGCTAITTTKAAARPRNAKRIEAFFCRDYHHSASWYCPETCGCGMVDKDTPVAANRRCPGSCLNSNKDRLGAS